MTPITRKCLSRRTVLRGLGASVALPFLDSMTPAMAAPETTSRPVRLAFIAIPNGVNLPDWTPRGKGRLFAFSPILKPLEPYRDDLLVLSGLAHANAYDLGDGPGDHARAGACFLTGVHPKKTAGADIQNGISADQIAAQALAAETRLSSLELGCEDARTVGNCDSGYSCAYTNSIAWRSPTTPLPPEMNPRSVFERLFGADDTPLDPETRARRAQQRKSILDLVAERSRQLLGLVGPADRRKVDEYLHAVREIERQIQRAEQDGRQITPTVEKPAGIPASFADHVKLMFDLQAVAFQADLTRVGTMMIGREGSLQTYPEIGVPDAHHPLTHHRGTPELVAKVAKVNTYHVELFSHFIGKLKATADGEGTLLDRTMVVYGSAISDGDRHTHTDLPVVVAGGRDLGLSLGRHVVYPKKTPMTNLYLSLLDRAGVRSESIGDSTGKLTQLGA
jgi:hypothetical protein